jgi:hypothetical protein
MDFEEAVENNTLEEFLRLIPPEDVQVRCPYTFSHLAITYTSMI